MTGERRAHLQVLNSRDRTVDQVQVIRHVLANLLSTESFDVQRHQLDLSWILYKLDHLSTWGYKR